MMSGMDRYYQIARCFRDEDLRADRQPEFTQIDVEASFVSPDDILRWIEGLVVSMAAVAGVDAAAPFQRMTWAESMDRYGSDRPMLRIDGSAYTDRVFGESTHCGAWIALQPGSRRNNKPGIMLVNAETRQLVGPLLIGNSREVLWISPDGQRILRWHDPMYSSPSRREKPSPLEWLTVRE